MKNAEKTAPGAFLKAVRVSGKGTKDSKGTKEGKKESGSRKKKRPAAETDAGVQTKKVLKRFCFRTSVKTATTYSPTCAVPSA